MINGDDTKLNELPISPLPPINISPPFPQRLKKKDDKAKFKKFLEKFSNLSINIQLLEALQKIPGFDQLMKSLVSKMPLLYCETINVNHNCSSII